MSSDLDDVRVTITYEKETSTSLVKSRSSIKTFENQRSQNKTLQFSFEPPLGTYSTGDG